MSNLLYKRRLLAAYSQGRGNKRLLVEDMGLEGVLLMDHPLRESAFVDWVMEVEGGNEATTSALTGACRN